MFLLKQRILGGGEKEPEDFKAKKKECFEYKKGLQQCEKAIKVWLDGASKMSEAAKSLAEVGGSTDVDLKNLGEQVSLELGPERSIKVCNEAIQSIELKIKLIDRLKKDAHVLDDRRLVRNRLQRKSEDANKKGDQELKDKLKREYDDSVASYNQLFSELDGSFNFLKEESKGHGGVGLARPEMDTFKKSTVDFFSSCNQICQGLSERLEPVDLSREWSRFQDRKDAKVEEVRNVRHSRFNSNAMQPDELAAAGIAQGGQPPPPPPPPPGAAGSQSNLNASQRDFSQFSGSSRDFSQPRPPPPTATPVAPPPPVAQPAGPIAKALYDYVPQNSDELPLTVGDMIRVTSQDEDGWWEGEKINGGGKGVFPSNYVALDGGSSRVVRGESEEEYAI